MHVLQGDRLLLRPWRKGDAEALVRHADDRAVWRNLTDRFPHPYTRRDARDWIRLCTQHRGPTWNFAITLQGEPVGSCGIEPGTGEGRLTGELGYWLGRSLWGHGYATEAARLVAAYGFAVLEVQRLQAGVYAWNPASARVLEKAGFHLESRQVRAIVKDGEITDRLLYVRLREP